MRAGSGSILCYRREAMGNKPCNKCLCCLNLPDCADFWEISGMPAPDYGCNEFERAGFLDMIHRLLGVL